MLPSINVLFTRAQKDPQQEFKKSETAAIDNIMPIYQIQWDTKTDVITLQMDNNLLRYRFSPSLLQSA